MRAYARLLLTWLFASGVAEAHTEWRFHSLPLPSETETELFREILVNDDGSLWAAITHGCWRRATGRGIGLAEVVGIVRGHHGAIEVLSEKGKGSTFTVFLPLREGE